ncbi:unnamed protein product [Pleuronectes platessa]|uniref:Uncharacterized protein n=1 Tax=Pleuronectes platessa TaxID=8262 RepID=A0A9N7UCU8_PLEPL|nr:unnamed protein product [Pleuronectes platessa]
MPPSSSSSSSSSSEVAGENLGSTCSCLPVRLQKQLEKMNRTQLRSHQPLEDQLRGNVVDSLTLKSITASRSHQGASRESAVPNLEDGFYFEIKRQCGRQPQKFSVSSQSNQRVLLDAHEAAESCQQINDLLQAERSISITSPGSEKQVKLFIQEPHEETQQTSEESAAKQETCHSRQESRENAALWNVIKQNELASAVRRELSDWLLSSLRSAGVQVAALDLSSRGTVNRSDVTHLFLKNFSKCSMRKMTRSR